MLSYGIFFYSVVLILFYVFIGTYSIGETKKYLSKNKFTDYRMLASSEHLPSVSILAPAYNEGTTIVENVRSLLSIYYSNLEVIIINDGSKDDSLQKLIHAYQLEKIDFFVRYQIETKKVRGVYKSKNPAFKRLIVVDKENGGKADALNTGVNISAHDYIISIDVDCVLEEDAILKLVKPFLEQTTKKVIAVGGVVRVANSCEIKDGKLVKVHLPKSYLPRMQALEYIRAFLLARMAWTRLNGLLLISGAFGAFDKEIVIKAGGYASKTLGEDMELVVRMRRYMEEKRFRYKVSFIPDPLCWTEVPATFKILARQRNRWMRGTIETLYMHKKMFFNPRYGLLGLLSYPYWFFFEMLAPIIEFLGFIAFIVMVILGNVVWPFFLSLFFFVIGFTFLYSSFAIFMEVITYNQYKRKREIIKLILTSFTEPFIFHPFVVWSSVKGVFDLVFTKKGWGEMTREGFGNITLERKAEVKHESGKGFIEKIKIGTGSFIPRFGLLVGFFLLLKIFELGYNAWLHGFSNDFFNILLIGFLKDISFLFTIAVWLYLGYLLFYVVHKKLANGFFIIASILLCSIQFALIQYFLTTLVPLGSDVWGYSWADIQQTVGAAGGIQLYHIIGFVVIAGLIIWAFIKMPGKVNISFALSLLLFGVFIALQVLNVAKTSSEWKTDNEYTNNLSEDKSYFFYSASINHFFPAENGIHIYPAVYSDVPKITKVDSVSQTVASSQTFTYVDPVNYPFLHEDKTSDVLSSFFNFDSTVTKPNIVIIIVEGLGRAFTNEGAYLGNFTPFLDSLSKQGLYWDNFLSEGGRTFAVLPSILGSLPFYQNGFAELGNNMPQHLSLISLLKHNGYRSSFYYGGDSHFDNMDLFLRKNNIDNLYDENSFPVSYSKMPSNNGFSWGYGDKDLVRRYFSIRKNDSIQPYLNVLMTVSTHDPFIVNDQNKYLERFEQRLNELGFDETKKEQARAYENQFATIMYTDDALRDFFVRSSKQADFNKTIFIITGDHRMPEIPMSTKIDRYHVPLIIYSPMLKQPEKFESISTHFDITPSILAMLKDRGEIQTPSLVSWMGSGLDTAKNFRNIHAYPLMQTKTEIIDFIMGNNMLNSDDLYTIQSTMGINYEDSTTLLNTMKDSFEKFKWQNQQVISGMKLIPDSIYTKYSH